MPDGSHTTALADFWSASVGDTDPALAASLSQEMTRQQTQIELIASENIVSRAVLEAQGSVLTNKYAEGYAGRPTTVAASTSTLPKNSPLNAPRRSMVPSTSTCSRTPGRRPTAR